MAIPTKSLDDMIREIIVNLGAGQPRQPAFTMLVGSGFSYPVIPTPTEMLKGDIAWWRYCKHKKLIDPFCLRSEGVEKGLATEAEIAQFERAMWKTIHEKAAARPKAGFDLSADGLPEWRTAQSVGLAYQAVMMDGLINNKMRRQYLRDAIRRSYPRVNGAHIFLASVLEAQETEGWQKKWGAPFCRTIFTTNFDPLLQRSLQLVNKLYYMSDRPDALEAPEDDESAAIHLVYTHGSVHRYDLLNTEEQIQAAREKNSPALIGYFRRHGVIVIGYSGWADTTMGALLKCASFDANLYWCDIHPPSEAETRLRPEVLQVLRAPAANAYYVPLAGADEAMRVLHDALELGPVPSFIRDPLTTMIAQLQSIEVSDRRKPVSEAAGTPTDQADGGGNVARQEASPLPTTLGDLLEGTLARLRVAKSAFDDPAVVRAASPQQEEELSRALIARLFSDAFIAFNGGNYDRACESLTAIIDTPAVPPPDRAMALNFRGVSWGLSGAPAKAIADYSAVIEMADAPAEQKALALYNRGVSWGRSGEPAKAIADYSAVIERADAPAEQKAQALVNRGVNWGRSGEPAKAIADYSAVIEMADAPAEQKAKALNNRGVSWGLSGEPAKEIADYSAVIEMADAPAEQKAKALFNRAVSREVSGEPAMAIADCSAVIEMADAPAEQKAQAYANRGWIRYTSMDDIPSMIEDSKLALSLKGDDLYARGNLALGLLLTGETASARSEFETLLSSTSDKEIIGAVITDLEAALGKRSEIEGAEEILGRLRAAIVDPAAHQP